MKNLYRVVMGNILDCDNGLLSQVSGYIDFSVDRMTYYLIRYY